MAVIRVMAVFQGASNLPEDRFINTFHFTHVGPGGPALQNSAREEVIAFYTNNTEGISIGGSLSPYVNRLAQVISYDLDLPEGEREPTPEEFTLPSVAGGGLPEEVAICVTLQGAPPVTPRRRGRIYIGPLTNDGLVYQAGSTTVPSRPQIGGLQSIGTTIADRCAFMATVGPTGLQWCIRSVTPSENFVPIVSGHIDNAWDTQRRRGPDPTDRQLWAAS